MGNTDNRQMPGAGVKSILWVALLTSLITGSLLWAFRPHPASGKVIPLLIQVTPAPGGAHLAVMNGGSGVFSIDLSGGEAAPGTEAPLADTHIRSQYSGSLSRLGMEEILKNGQWISPTGARLSLPAGSQTLPPGHYVVEITGSDHNGAIYAGAQSFKQ